MAKYDKDLATALSRGLGRVGARNSLLIDELFRDPKTLLDRWPSFGPERLHGLYANTARKTGPLVTRYLQRVVSAEAGFVPAPAEIGLNAERYAKAGPPGVSIRDAGSALPTQVRGRMAEGQSLSEAVGVLHRKWQGQALGEPFRLSRAMQSDITTGPSPLWRGWARIAEPGACAFCQSLASGSEFYTQDTAAPALQYHARCRCTAAPVVDKAGAEKIKALNTRNREIAPASPVRPPPTKYSEGARTIERRKQLELQVSQLRERAASNKWSADRLMKVRAELAAL